MGTIRSIRRPLGTGTVLLSGLTLLFGGAVTATTTPTEPGATTASTPPSVPSSASSTGSTGSTTPDVAATAPAGSQGLAVGDEFTIAGALHEVPADLFVDGAFVTVADLDAATELNGLSRPTSPEPDEVMPWLMGLTGPSPDAGTAAPPIFVAPSEMFNPSMASRWSEVDQEAGFTMVDVSAFVSIDAPPAHLVVAAGDFDERTLAPTLTPVGDGIVSFGEGEDLAQDLQNRSALSPLGRPIRFAESGGRIAISTQIPTVEAWLTGSADTLADLPGVSEVARALDDAGAVSAVIARTRPADPAAIILGSNATPERIEQLQEELAEQAPQISWDIVGIGWGVDDAGDAQITLAYRLLDGEDTATRELTELFANGTSLINRRALSELLVLHDVVVADGVAVVTLGVAEASRPATIFQMLLASDLPFVVAP